MIFEPAAVEKRVGLSFKDEKLLEQIFVHRSFLNEHPGFDLPHNERLEFLGDAVLELVVTEYLYKNFENPEGELTNWRSALVKGEHLAEVAKRLGFDRFIHLSKGEEQSGGRHKQLILANTFEAFIGALYLDKGYRKTAEFIKKEVIHALKEILEKKLFLDPKSHFQEIVQDQIGVTPNYRVLSERGPDHARVFVVGAFINDTQVGEGEGASKQAAQTGAAKDAIGGWREKYRS